MRSLVAVPDPKREWPIGRCANPLCRTAHWPGKPGTLCRCGQATTEPEGMAPAPDPDMLRRLERGRL